MEKYPLVSIIIPLYVITDRFFEDFKKFEKIRYPKFEIIVVCDKNVTLPQLKNIPVTFLLTGKKNTGPAEKRDLALKKAKGEICAFIDDDAYPDPDWIKHAIGSLLEEDIVAVGGPGITPPEDSYFARLGGHVYESVLVSGGFRERFLVTKKKKVRDWPGFNFFAKTDVLKKVGGWGSSFYGGEDTFLCLKLLDKGTIVYEPQAIVYHHRRALFSPHLRQIYNVGIHRGFFARVFPKTSRLLVYFVPTMLDVYLFILIFLSFFSEAILAFFIFQLVIAFLLSYFSVFPKAGLIGSIIASIGILLTHSVYGIGFVKGFLTKNLTR